MQGTAGADAGTATYSFSQPLGPLIPSVTSQIGGSIGLGPDPVLQGPALIGYSIKVSSPTLGAGTCALWDDFGNSYATSPLTPLQLIPVGFAMTTVVSIPNDTSLQLRCTDGLLAFTNWTFTDQSIYAISFA